MESYDDLWKQIREDVLICEKAEKNWIKYNKKFPKSISQNNPYQCIYNKIKDLDIKSENIHDYLDFGFEIHLSQGYSPFSTIDFLELTFD